MIYYLQQIEPPVLPVLQEFPQLGENLRDDELNVSFFSDLDRIDVEWSGYKENKMSVGELWLGFLDFYTGEFDDKELVVSIRKHGPVTKVQKDWNFGLGFLTSTRGNLMIRSWL